MRLEEALLARLAADATIAASAAGRIGWGEHLAGLPAIALQVVADPRPQHFKGFERVRQTSVQVDVYAATSDAAAALRDQVIELLVQPDASTGVRFQRAFVVNVRGGEESQQPIASQRVRAAIARESIDFIFTHNAR